MDNLDKIIAALKVAQAAKKYAQAVDERKQAQHTLERAYLTWKIENRVGFVEKGTDDWEAMLDATASEHTAVRRAKRRESYYRDLVLKLAGEV